MSVTKFQRRSAQIIKKVAEETGFKVSGKIQDFTIDHAKFWHVNGWRCICAGSGYIEVQQWEENGGYSRGVASIRTILNVLTFCNIIKGFFELRGRRRD